MNRPLRIGLQLPEVERPVSWPELAAMAILAEEVGFDSLWVGDHLLYRPPGEPARGPWEAWTVLAGLAAVTTRVTLGPLVAATSFHAPAMLAKKAATVDEISGGRLVVGLGAGWNRVEYDAFGFAFDHRIARFAEAFTIIRRLLAGQRVDFAGTYHRVDGAELVPPPRPGGPPLMVGSRGPRMLRITLGYVDAWNAWWAWFGNTPDGFAALTGAVDAACREVGRDPAEVERTAAVLVRLPGGTGRIQGDPDRGDAVPLSGAPADLTAALRAFHRAGVAHIQIVADPITPESIERLAPTLERLRQG
jgi:alkanesulfonate monooxygenase SsuD/methylene tetrahydromethanopterin reductase-like flavin-dependent oxidoreductase (luciferase family)